MCWVSTLFEQIKMFCVCIVRVGIFRMLILRQRCYLLLQCLLSNINYPPKLHNPLGRMQKIYLNKENTHPITNQLLYLSKS